MLRRLIALLILTLACTPMFLRHSPVQSLESDSDTKAIIHAIRKRHDPLSWFKGDWPLQNHLYRPIVTLTFELDNALYGDDAAGYARTNALLCLACVFALFWFSREFTDSLSFAVTSGAIFAFWVIDAGRLIPIPAEAIAVAVFLLGIARHGRRIANYVPAALVISYIGVQLAGLSTLQFRVLHWLPGRTATVMTLFALISLAAYSRYERLHAARRPVQKTPLDLPATRMSIQRPPSKPPPWIWPVFSLMGAALALASYEQAVMLPAALVAVCVSFSCRGYRTRWWMPISAWLLLGGYLLLRHAVLPRGLSAYEAQQLRHGTAPLFDLVDYLLPTIPQAIRLWMSLGVGALIFLTAAPYKAALALSANLVALFETRRQWTIALAGLALSIITFLPMAFVKPFDHYQFWPMAVRTVFVTSMICIAGQLLVNAASPQAVQAPRRLSPAPGSLPHP